MRSHRWTIRASSIAMLMAAICTQPLARGDEALRQRLLTEAPRGWDAWRERSRRLEGWGLGVYTGISPEGMLPWCTKSVFRFAGDSTLLETGFLIPGGPETSRTVVGRNDRYVFHLRRESPAAAWKTIHAGGDAQDFQDAEEAINESVLEHVEAPWVVVGKSLPTWIHEPGFTIRKVERVDEGDDARVKLEFDYEPAGHAAHDTAVRGGWITFSPDEDWSVREYDLKLFWGRLVGTIRYDRDEEGNVILRSVDQRYGEAGSRNVACFDFHEYRRRDVPAEAFTLTAFGLPEFDAPDE